MVVSVVVCWHWRIIVIEPPSPPMSSGATTPPPPNQGAAAATTTASPRPLDALTTPPTTLPAGINRAGWLGVVVQSGARWLLEGGEQEHTGPLWGLQRSMHGANPRSNSYSRRAQNRVSTHLRMHGVQAALVVLLRLRPPPVDRFDSFRLG